MGRTHGPKIPGMKMLRDIAGQTITLCEWAYCIRALSEVIAAEIAWTTALKRTRLGIRESTHKRRRSLLRRGPGTDWVAPTSGRSRNRSEEAVSNDS